jgi:hypothetical protein
MTEKTSSEACAESAKIANEEGFQSLLRKEGVENKKPSGIPDGLQRLQGVFRLFNGLLQLI